MVLGINRVSVVGVKYACLGQEYWDLIKSKDISNMTFGRRIMILTWLFDRPKYILLCALADEDRNGVLFEETDRPENTIRWINDSPKNVVLYNDTISKYQKAANEINTEYNVDINIEYKNYDSL